MVVLMIVICAAFLAALLAVLWGGVNDGDEASDETETSVISEAAPDYSPDVGLNADVSAGTGEEADANETTAANAGSFADYPPAFWQRINGSTATMPLTAAIYKYFGGVGAAPFHDGTYNAYYRLKRGEDGLIFATEPLETAFYTPDDIESGLIEITPVVKDALVFLVNAENPVDGISIEQLRDIYMGRITNWKEVGGLDESITAYQRNADSGSDTLFMKLLMDGREPSRPPVEWRVESMGGLVEALSDYDNSKNALGYSVFYYVNNMYGNSRFKLLAVDGVKPSRETIADGSYPLSDYYYAVIAGYTPADSKARTLIDWLLTQEGQTVAANAGYIPLIPIDTLPDYGIDPVYLGDTENSSGTGGTALKTKEEFDALTAGGVRKPLSDIFFDGFNYIRYINDKLADLVNAYDGGGHMIRPFTGIPDDYPNYELYESVKEVGDEVRTGRYIRIEFPAGNPFFRSAIHYTLRLTQDLSPYGSGLDEYSVIYDYDRRLMEHIDLFTLKLDMPKSPDVAERINTALKNWTDGFPGSGESAELLRGLDEWVSFTAPFKPLVGRWKNYLTVYYETLNSDMMPLLSRAVYTICFDLNTGETVRLADMLPKDLNFANANIYSPAVFSGGDMVDESDSVPDGYIPAEGSVVTEAWIREDGALCMYLTEPDGRRLQAIFYGAWR
jgi:phosphate transport system substrate-binding protein